MIYALMAIVGYLMGSSNMAWYLGKARGFDIRSHGSNNAGASNAAVTMGMKAGIIVAIHDIGKSCLAALLASVLFPDLPYIGAVAGVSAVLGHIFPFFLSFKGGKGLAPFMGLALALDWRLFLMLALAILLVTLITDYIVLGTFTAMVSFPAYLYFTHESIVLISLVSALSLVMLYKHAINIKRLCTGQEIGLRRTLSKKDRV